VRTVKVYLEECNLLDKNRAISKVTSKLLGASAAVVQVSPVLSDAVSAGDKGRDKGSDKGRGSLADVVVRVSPVESSDIVAADARATAGATATAAEAAQQLEFAEYSAKYMAVPVTADLASQLLRGEIALGAALGKQPAAAGTKNPHSALTVGAVLQALYHMTSASTAPPIKTPKTAKTPQSSAIDSEVSSAPVPESAPTTASVAPAASAAAAAASAASEPYGTLLCISGYDARESKRTHAGSSFQRATEFLAALAQLHGLPLMATGAAAITKFEVVGDVLMLPESYLVGPEWEALLGLSLQENVAVDSKTVSYRRKVLETLARYFGLERVARKAEIDSGPKRESRVRMLYPVVGMPETTGPNSPAWVTVTENRIKFGFDITRVMFCSGNVTERMRMGQQKASGNVIVDLYCGIGYYTVPLLVQGGAAYVHACEWNPNSILAIKHNLQANGVSPDRYSVYEGDNRITSKSLIGIADRVLLGLLPSSVQGWPLAARALKPTGGLIHVHENVHENILAAWVEETRAEFQRLLRTEFTAQEKQKQKQQQQQEEEELLSAGAGVGAETAEAGEVVPVEGNNNSNSMGAELEMHVTIVHLEKVKSYAPRVFHVVLDLQCVLK
jgi:tRNA G37 N-methylase Trm5